MTNFSTYLQESLDKGENEIVELISTLYKSKLTLEWLNYKYNYEVKSKITNVNRMINEVEKLYNSQFPDKNLNKKLL